VAFVRKGLLKKLHTHILPLPQAFTAWTTLNRLSWSSTS